MVDGDTCNSVLVVSCEDEGDLNSLLNGICSEIKQHKAETEEDSSLTCMETCDAHRRFEISNKYYSARICLKSRTAIPTQSSVDEFEACVISFNSNFETSFDRVKMWFEFIDQLENPPTSRLILDTSSQIETADHDARKQNALSWCVENEVELIDTFNDDNEDDSDFDVSGFKRIYQALSAHVWPNMNMKQDSNINSALSSLINQTNIDTTGNKKDENTLDDDDDTASDHSIPYMELTDQDNNPSNNDDIDDESFGNLFENMRTMKENASSLPPNERKAYAEKVVLAFWKAMEGDSDEIDGLD